MHAHDPALALVVKPAQQLLIQSPLVGRRTRGGSSPPCRMMPRTALRLNPSYRAISAAGMPSWCNRKMALRLSVSIMELLEGVKESPRAAQDPGGQ